MSTGGIAVVACAIAAVASGGAAIVALIYSNQATKIAENQLQATYLSNLYNKQVDGITALSSATNQVTSSDYFLYTQTIRIYPERISNIKDLQTGVKKSGADFNQRQLSSYFSAAHAVGLVSPLPLAMYMRFPITKLEDAMKAFNEYIVSLPTLDNLQHFSSLSNTAFDAFLESNQNIERCGQAVLPKGTPITEERLAQKECSFVSSVK